MYLQLGIQIGDLVIRQNYSYEAEFLIVQSTFYQTCCEFSIRLLKVMPLADFCCIIHFLKKYDFKSFSNSQIGLNSCLSERNQAATVDDVQFCHLLTLMYFQICMFFFHLHNIKDIGRLAQLFCSFYKSQWRCQVAKMT